MDTCSDLHYILKPFFFWYASTCCIKRYPLPCLPSIFFKMVTGVHCVYHLPGAMLSAFCELIPTTDLQSMHYYHSYLIDELIETQKC